MSEMKSQSWRAYRGKRGTDLEVHVNSHQLTSYYNHK